MRKASTVLLEQGTQTPSPAPDLIPAETKNQPRTHIGIGTANGGTSSRQYIDKLLKPPATTGGGKNNPGLTPKELLQAKVVELETKVEELNAELATARTPEAQLPLSVKAEPAPAKITSGVPDCEYEEEPTFDDVVHYFESLDEDDQIQQITELCHELGIESLNL